MEWKDVKEDAKTHSPFNLKTSFLKEKYYIYNIFTTNPIQQVDTGCCYSGIEN